MNDGLLRGPLVCLWLCLACGPGAAESTSVTSQPLNACEKVADHILLLTQRTGSTRGVLCYELFRDAGEVNEDRVDRAVSVIGSPKADATATSELRRGIRDSLSAVDRGRRWAQVFWWPNGLGYDLSPAKALEGGVSASPDAETSVILIPHSLGCLEMRVVWPMSQVHYRVRKSAGGLIDDPALGRLSEGTSAVLALASVRPEMNRVERKIGESLEIVLVAGDQAKNATRWLVQVKPRTGKDALLQRESTWINDRLVYQWQVDYVAGDDLPTSATEFSSLQNVVIKTLVRMPELKWTGVSVLPYLRAADFDVVQVGQRLREAGYSFALLEPSEQSREVVLRLGLPL